MSISGVKSLIKQSLEQFSNIFFSEATTPEITTIASTSTIYENTSTDTEITDTSESTIITTEANPTTNSDPCLLPKEIGFCEPSDSGQPITRFFFDNEQSKKCQAFTFMGCGGNENNFITKHECQAVCQSSIDDQDQEVKNNDFFHNRIFGQKN